MEDCSITRMPMIGDMAPSFHAVTTRGEMDFPKDYSGRWVVFFSVCSDFTPVCTTELMTFAMMKNQLEELDTELVGLSTASVYSHIAWLRKIKELAWKDMKHVEITFPLIADTTTEIAGKYGMLQSGSCGHQMVRAVYIIDTEGKIRAILFYPDVIGRNIQEINRMVMALQKTDKEKVATPAGWNVGEDVMLLPPTTLSTASDRVERIDENRYSLDWFLSFRQSEDMPQVPEIMPEPEVNPYPSAYPVRRRNNVRR